jgi:hypothetical protein
VNPSRGRKADGDHDSDLDPGDAGALPDSLLDSVPLPVLGESKNGRDFHAGSGSGTTMGGRLR